ncbi:MAG: 3'-5' exonuclease [Deltaproteobacteria bacterium]|nr:3'-5' exonuclease [Deltaproteobacteria bacterium]
MHAKFLRHLRYSPQTHSTPDAPKGGSFSTTSCDACTSSESMPEEASPLQSGLHLRLPHRARRRSALGVARPSSLRKRSPRSKSDAWWQLPFLCIDLETTGLCSGKDRIIEVGGVRFQQTQCTASFSQLLFCERQLSPKIRSLTGIDPNVLLRQPNVEQVLRPLAQQMQEVEFIVAYHVPFDRSFLEAAFARAHIPFPQRPWVDALLLARHLDQPNVPMNLAQTAERWGILRARKDEAHRALPDAQMAGELLLKLAPRLRHPETRHPFAHPAKLAAQGPLDTL